MTEQEIFEKVKEIIVAQTGESDAAVRPQANIKDDLNADSLDVFEVINELEDEFDIKIESEDGIQTVQDLVDFVQKQLAAKEG